MMCTVWQPAAGCQTVTSVVGRRLKLSYARQWFDMQNVTRNKSVEFFETQFQRQIRQQGYALNPF